MCARAVSYIQWEVPYLLWTDCDLDAARRATAMRAAIRRFGYATATGTAALGTAWLCSQAKDARGLRALKPQQLLQSSLISKHWVSGDTVRLRFALPSSEHVLGLPVPGHLVVVDATNYSHTRPSH